MIPSSNLSCLIIHLGFFTDLYIMVHFMQWFNRIYLFFAPNSQWHENLHCCEGIDDWSFPKPCDESPGRHSTHTRSIKDWLLVTTNRGPLMIFMLTCPFSIPRPFFFTWSRFRSAWTPSNLSPCKKTKSHYSGRFHNTWSSPVGKSSSLSRAFHLLTAR